MGSSTAHRTRLLLAAALALAVLAPLAWIWLAATAGVGDRAPVPANGAAVALATDAAGLDSAEPERALVEASAAARAPLAEPADDPRSGIRVAVMERATAAPLPDAEVFAVIDLDGSKMSWPERQELRNLLLDRERLIHRYGQPRQIDREGIVMLPRPMTGGAVCARHGDLYGELLLGADPEHALRLELVPDRTLRVRVLDASGAPAAGVAVALEMRVADLGDVRVQPAGTTDALGEVELRHLHHQVAAFVASHGRVDSVAVVPNLPGIRTPRAAFDPQAPPADPVLLRLEPTGSVIVRFTDGRGGTIAKAGSVQLGTVVDGQPPTSSIGVDLHGNDLGEARFPHVALGQILRVMPQMGGSVCENLDVHGPTVAGETVTVDVPVVSTRPMLAVRVVDSAGAPVPIRGFWAVVQAPGGDHRMGEATDADGRLTLLLPPRLLATTVAELVLHEHERGRPTGRLARAPVGFPLRPGEIDLGTCTLDGAPLVVAGRAIDHLGNGLRPRIEVQRRAGAPGQERWEADATLAVRQEDDGSFEVTGAAGQGPLRVAASLYRYVPVPPVDITPGQRDVRLVLTAAGSAAVRVLAAPELPLVRLQATLLPPAADALVRALSWTGDGVAEHVWSELAPGRYGMRITVVGDPMPLALVKDIEVLPGATARDPRIWPLDLRQRLRVLTVRLLDQDGDPVKAWRGGVFCRHLRSGEVLDGFPAPDGVARIPLAPASVDLLVSVPGYRPEELLGVSTDVEVRLRPGPEVTLALGNLPPLAPGERLELGLRAAEPQTAVQYRFWGSSVLARPDAVPPALDVKVTADQAGLATLRVGAPGRYRVQARVLPPSGFPRAVPVRPAEVEVADAGAQRLALTVAQPR